MKFSVSVVAVLVCLCGLKGIMASSYGNSGYGSNYGKYGGMSMGYGQGSYGLGYEGMGGIINCCFSELALYKAPTSGLI
jgi:hypothetical protein